MRGYTIAISIDEDSGGFYIYRSKEKPCFRICLGHIAITFIGFRFDTLLASHLQVLRGER